MEFVAFDHIHEALSFLSQNRRQSKILSGGTDLLIALRKKDPSLNSVKYILSLNHIPSLKNITCNDFECVIGGATTFKTILSNKGIIENFPLLADAVLQIGSPQIRNVATIGGNICNLAACADSIAPLLIYDAKVRIQSVDSDRVIPLEKILIKPYTVNIQSHEILSEVLLPLPDKTGKSCFHKLGRRRGVSISRMSYAIYIRTENSTLMDFRIALGSLFPIPRRLRSLENEIIGSEVNPQLWRDVSRKIAHQIVDETGIRWSTRYKSPTIQQLLYTSLTQLT